MTANYPIQKLLFFVAQDVDESTRQTIGHLVDELAASRAWVIGPPRLVDDVDESGDPAVDLPVVTLGGVLEIYSALPPVDLPRDIDQKHLEEVTSLVEAVKKVSSEAGLAFEFELDGKFVGAVEDGMANRTLQVGLLDEWQRVLQERPN